MKLILGTRNPGKIKLYARAFVNLGFSVTSLQPQVVEENASTPEGNALLKARSAWQDGLFVFADDAGLSIDALSGEPGVQTRRWNGKFPNSLSDETWLDYLLTRLRRVPSEKRTANIVTGWAIIGPGGEEITSRIVTPFKIAEKTLRPMEPGFPLSAVTIGHHEENLDQRVARLLAQWSELHELIKQYR